MSLNQPQENSILELAKHYGITVKSLEVLSNKDGVLVVVLQDGLKNPVLKYFENPLYIRELEIYKLFNQLGIMTMPIIAMGDNSLLLENMADHPTERLALKSDLENPGIVKGLANWYRNLHKAGKTHLQTQGDQGFYSELRLLTPENLLEIKEKSGYDCDEFWIELPIAVDRILTYLESHKTITYNDFFYGNAVVSKSLDDAYIFDYNFVGAGLAFFDISNVLSGLPESMHSIFCEAYGEIEPYEREINNLVSPLIGLAVAYERTQFPEWGMEALAQLRSGEIFETLQHFVNFNSDDEEAII